MGSSATDDWCMPDSVGMRNEEMDLFLALQENQRRGKWTRDEKSQCGTGGPATDRARSYSPYRSNDAVTCNVVDEVGLGEIGCGAMRNAGVDCCYANGRGECGFERRCKYDGGLFVLPNNDWEVEIFGNPEKNHLNHLANGLIAGRANVPNGIKVVPFTHSHGDDATDAQPLMDDGKIDGQDDPYDDAAGPGQENDGDEPPRLVRML